MSSLRDFAPGYDTYTIDDLVPGYSRPVRWQEPERGPAVNELLDRAEAEDMSEFGKGWRSSGLGLEAAYLAAEQSSLRAKGEDEAADLLEPRRRAFEARAQLFKPRVSEFTDVLEQPSLRNAGDWLMSNAGSLGASMQDMIVAGGAASTGAKGLSAIGTVVAPFTGPAAPFVAGGARLLGAAAPYIGEAAAFVPNYLQAKGNTASSMEEDKDLMARTTAEERDNAAALSGVGQAALDTLIPGAMRRRVMGENLYGAVERGFNKLPLAAGVALDSLGEGAQEVAQDRIEKAALSYLNPERNTDNDWKDAINNFAAGAAGSPPMGVASRLAQRARERFAVDDGNKYGDETTVDNDNTEDNLKELDKLTRREINDDNIIDHITKPRARFESMDDVNALTGLISGDRVEEAVTEADLLAAQTERKQAVLDELSRFPASKTARKLAKEVAAVPLDSPLDAINLLEDDMSSPINRAATYVIDKLNIPDEDAARERYNAEGIVRLDRRAKAEDNLIGRRDQMALTEERIRSGLDPTVSSDEATTYGEYAGGQRDFAEDLQDEFPAVHPTTEDVKARVKPKSPIIDPKSFVFDLTPDMFSDIGEVSPTRQEDALKGYPKPGETAKANAQRDKDIAHALDEYNARLSFTARRLHTAANDAAPTSFVETNKIAEELQALTTLKVPTSASTRRGMRLADRVFDLVDGDGEVAKQLIYDIWHSSGGSKAFEPVVNYMESIADRTPTSYKVEQKTREDAADEIAKLIPASVQMRLMDEHGIDFGNAQTRDRMLEVMERHVDGRSGTTDAKLNELFTEPVVRSISNYLGRKIVPRLGGVTWSNVDEDGTVSQHQLSSDGVSLDDDEAGGALGDESDTSDYDRDGFQASLDALPPKAMIVPVSGGIRDLKDAWKEKDKGGVRSLLSLDADGHDTLMSRIKDRVTRVQKYLGDEHVNYQIGDPGSSDPFVRAGATPVSKIMDRTGVAPLKRTEMMLEHMANDGQVDVGKANHALTAYRHLKRIDEDLSNIIAGRETVGPDGGKLSMRAKAETLSSTAEQLLALDPTKLQGIIGDKALTALKELRRSVTHGGLVTNYLPDGSTETAAARPTSLDAFYTRIAPAIHKWTRKAQQNLQQTIPYYDSYLKRNPEGDLDGFTREYFNERYMVVAAQNSNVDHMKMDPVTFEGLADKGARALSSVWTKAGDDVEESNRVRASMNLLHFKSPHGSLPPELAAKRRAERAAAKKAGVEYKQTPEQKAADDAQREVAIPAYALVEYAREGRYAHSDVTRNEADSKSPGQQQKEYRDLMMDGITTLIHSGLVTGLPWIHNAKGEREDFKSRTLGAAPGHPQQRLLFDEDRGELPPSLDLGGTTLAKHQENMAYGVKMQEKRRAEMGAKKRAELDVMAGLKKDAELGADTFDGQTREQQDDSDVERTAIIGGRDEQRRDIQLRTSELAAAADPLPRSMTPGKAVNLAKHVADGIWRDYVSDRAKGLQRIFSYVGSMDTIGSGSGKQYAAPLAALMSPANLARAHADDLDTLLEVRRRAVQALLDLAYPKSGIAKVDRAKVRQIANVLSGATDAAIFAKDDKARKPSKDGRPERERAELAEKASLFGDNQEVPISKVESFLKSIASTPTVGLQSQFANESEAAELAKPRPKANITAMDARQRAAIARSLGRLGNIFGHIARPYKFVAQESKNRGTTYSAHNTIGVNFAALRGDERWPADMPLQHRLDWVVSHELGHAHDLNLKINGKPASLGGKSLKPGGWAYNEAEAARKKLPFLDWVYKYALEQPSGDERARELFAQHIALLNYNKELLREHLPQTFAALVDSTDDASPPGWSHEGGNRGSGEARVRDGSGVHGSVSGDGGGQGADGPSREVPGQAERNDSKTAKEVGRRADGRAVSTTAGEEARKVETKEPRQVSAQATADTPKTTQKHTPSSPIQAPGAPETASVGVGSQKPAQGAKKDLDATVLKYSKMLDNPPDGFTTAHTEKIKTWAEKQYTKLGEELKAETDQKSDRAMELADQRSDLKALAEKAGASIAADKHSEQQTMGAQSTAADLSKDSEATPRAGGTVGGAHEAPSPVRKFDAYVQLKYNAEAAKNQTQTTPTPLVQNPGKFEKATRTPTSIEVTAAVKAYFAKTLAPKVRVMLQEMFPELAGKGNASWDAENLLAKISTANPTKTMEWAYHEAMHAFFTTVINAKGMKDVRDMLFDVVGDDSKLYARLKDMLKESPVALEHMEKSKEERVAYAFQFWAADMLSIAKKPETFFEKVQALMRHVFGLVSNDEKAMMLFEAFNGGKLREPSAAGKAILQIMQTGEWRKNFLAKIDKQFQAVYTEVMANHLVYRTSESATFRKIGPKFVSIASYGADKEGAAGMIDKTRMKRGEYSNRIRDVLDQLKGPNLKRDLKMLVDALNEHTTPELAHVAKAKDEIHALIEDFYDYSQKAGLDLGKQLGPDGKYWPRVMDLDKMINGKEAFIKMLVDNYPVALRNMKGAVQRANPKVKVTEVEVAHAVYQGIVDRMGNVDPRIKAMREDGVLNPYFAASNERHLDWIRDADIKPFLSEDVVGSLTQYFHQGVRAVEYKRAFGQDGIELQDMMATKGDLKYVDENGDAVRYDEDGPVRSELVAAAGKQGLRGKELDAWVNRRMDDYKRANGAMEGSLGKDISAGLRNFQSMAMTYQVVRLLPLMIFSSMLDPNGIRVAGGTADDMFNAYKRGFTGLWNNWKELLMGEAKDRKVDDLERAALDAMVINSDAEIEDMGTVHSSEYLSGVARRVNHAFFKAIGITQWDRDMRIMATDAARKAIVRDYNNAVPEHSERWLRELGLKRGDIFVKDGELIVSPEVLAAERGWSVAEARERLQPTHFAINRWVNRAIVSPNAGLRPTRASDPHFAMFFQFKSFTYAFQETTMRFALHEAENGNKTAAFQLLRGIPVMLAADLTKAMVTGGGSLPGYMANWTLADWLSHAINRSGVGGTTSFITDALGGNVVGVLAGPTVDHAVSTVGDVLSGNPGHALAQSLPGVRQLAMAGS